LSDLIADIAVNVPVAQLFSYLIPEVLTERVQIGMRVKVPFGRRALTGCIVRVRKAQAGDLKKITELLDAEPLLSEAVLTLLQWAAQYYCHPIGRVISNALPADLGSNQASIQILKEAVYTVKDATVLLRGEKQRELLTYLEEVGRAGMKELREHFSSPGATLKRMVELGCLSASEEELIRDPFASARVEPDEPKTLNAAQAQAVNSISAALEKDLATGYLLHGVTGSGKTEVYLQSVAACLELGRQALILVPEISLTPQLVARFRARFDGSGSVIAVLHSGLSAGERYDAWRRIYRGQVQIVIGARSAVFAPLARPGLIVVDEEHDGSYKQGEGFRYSARDLALMRGQQQKCPVVLGSATPSFGSYHRAQGGYLQRLSLEQRVHEGALPAVELVDLRNSKLETSLSPVLVEALQQTLEERQQAMLLLNRRGYSPFLMCTDCGESFHCPNCEITLTYHQRRSQLRCHYCDYVVPVPESCPKCQGTNIEPQGAGTERLEEELQELFPGARVARMDRDTTGRKGAHQQLLEKMLNREIDILVGTQMIAKGHDFPGVSLVGVLSADSGLNLPDFRSAERSFALLTQVAGRAGRSSGGGRVFIQSYNPEHYALACTVAQDYRQFYDYELPFRKELGYPPFGHLVNLVLAGNVEAQVRRSAEDFAGQLQREAGAVDVLGPSPCPLSRLRGKSRFQILLKSSQRRPLRQLLGCLDVFSRTLPRQVSLSIDVDPLDML
jgi:primosomal protein N' (replication factor Y)